MFCALFLWTFLVLYNNNKLISSVWLTRALARPEVWRVCHIGRLTDQWAVWLQMLSRVSQVRQAEVSVWEMFGAECVLFVQTATKCRLLLFSHWAPKTDWLALLDPVLKCLSSRSFFVSLYLSLPLTWVSDTVIVRHEQVHYGFVPQNQFASLLSHCLH